MKKSFIKIITILAAVSVAVSCLIFTASASSTTISFSSSKPSVNDSVTVTVTVNTDENMYGTEFSVNYNPDVLRFESGENATGGAGVVKVVYSVSGKTKQSCPLKFTAIASGSCTVSVDNAMYASDKEIPLTGSSATLAVTDAAKSDNANLKSLSLSAGTLSPKFSASKTSYTAKVAKNVTECKIFATAADSGAKVEVSGTSALNEGKNVRTVTVTAPSGAQKVYTITITRSDEEPEESSQTEPQPNETVIDGMPFTVLTDISGITLPNGFSADTADFNGTQVAVAKDTAGYYTVYYLKGADDSCVPYLLSEDGKTFEKLKYAVFGNNTYIFADVPDGYKAPSGYYETTVDIGGFNIKAFAVTNTETVASGGLNVSAADADYSDFYYVYCFFNGNFSMYRYDSAENVLQRAPEFKLVKEELETKPGGFGSRFASLSANAKIMVIGLVVALIAAAVLVVLLVLKLVKGNDNKDDIAFTSDFDEVAVSDGAEKYEDEATEDEEQTEEEEKL